MQAFKKLIFIPALLLSGCFSAVQPRVLSAFQPPARLGKLSASDWYQRLSPELQRYYAPAQGKQGQALFLALSQIVNQAQVLDYLEATSYLYTVVERVQQGKSSYVRAAYSDLLIAGDGSSGHKYQEVGDANGDGKKGDAINCEHTWPQSFFNKEGAMRTDLHHLFATLSTPNSQRGSLPLGLASEGKIIYATKSGSRLVSRPNGSPVFEPGNAQKGNSARALLYFYLRYHGQSIRNGEYQTQDFFINRLPQFQAWMQSDPIDTQEQARNQLIAQRQGNRNPFIDIPDLISLIGLDTFQQLEKRLAIQ
jgi:endonuclease I